MSFREKHPFISYCLVRTPMLFGISYVIVGLRPTFQSLVGVVIVLLLCVIVSSFFWNKLYKDGGSDDIRK